METDMMLQPAISQKPVRKRMKAIYKKIREQMEFYFSDANLHKDRFLKKRIVESADGYVDISLFLTFNRIQALTVDVNVLTKAISHSEFLQLSEDHSSVKRRLPISDPGNVDDRTVYVECLPNTVDQDWIRKVFSECGKIAYISIPRYKSTKDPKGFAFVEFETEEGAQKACEELNNPPVDAGDRVGKFPNSNKQIEILKKKVPVLESMEESKTSTEKELVPVDNEMPDAGERAEAIATAGAKGSKRSRRRRKTSEGKDSKKVDGQEKASGTKDDSSIDQHEKTDKDRSDKEYDQGEPMGNFEKDEGCSAASRKRKHDSEFVDSEDSKDKTFKQSLVEQTQKRRKHESQESTATSGSVDKPKSESSDTPESSPTKRKTDEQKEKGFLCAEDADSLKGGDIEKLGKKRSRKRKSRTRTDSGTETDKDSLEKKRDSVGSRESIERLEPPAKMQRKEGVIEVKGPTVKEGKKKKRKRKKKNKDKYIPEIRVIPKVKWLELRKEYLELQKKSMRELKRTLVELKLNVKQDGRREKMNMEGAQEMKVEKKTNPLEFVPNVIVKIASTEPLFRQKIKMDITSLGEDVHVAYIDVKDETNSGFIRFKNSQSAQKIITSSKLDKYSPVLLTGDEERAYWDKMAADRETKLSAKRPKKRGHQRLLDRAQKARSENMEAKHIIFGDG